MHAAVSQAQQHDPVEELRKQRTGTGDTPGYSRSNSSTAARSQASTAGRVAVDVCVRCEVGIGVGRLAVGAHDRLKMVTGRDQPR